VIQRWLDIYRDCGEYISTGVGVVYNKGMDGCPLTHDRLNESIPMPLLGMALQLKSAHKL
jgi:hypothetical protein